QVGRSRKPRTAFVSANEGSAHAANSLVSSPHPENRTQPPLLAKERGDRLSLWRARVLPFLTDGPSRVFCLLFGYFLCRAASRRLAETGMESGFRHGWQRAADAACRPEPERTDAERGRCRRIHAASADSGLATSGGQTASQRRSQHLAPEFAADDA